MTGSRSFRLKQQHFGQHLILTEGENVNETYTFSYQLWKNFFGRERGHTRLSQRWLYNPTGTLPSQKTLIRKRKKHSRSKRAWSANWFNFVVDPCHPLYRGSVKPKYLFWEGRVELCGFVWGLMKGSFGSVTVWCMETFGLNWGACCDNEDQ